MTPRHHQISDDPLLCLTRLVNQLHTQWVVRTYPFYSVGKNFWIHRSCELSRRCAPFVQIGSDVVVHRDVWLNIPFIPEQTKPILVLGDGCRIGRGSMISAQNRIEIGSKTIISPRVLVMDHNHAFENVDTPIIEQGNTDGGTVQIEDGSWIGYGAAIVCGRGELVVGRNSVIGANSVVTRSVPAYTVVAGNPARVVTHFDASERRWVRPTEHQLRELDLRVSR